MEVSFLSDSDEDENSNLPPLHQEIFDELLNSDNIIEAGPFPDTGADLTPSPISEEQTLFTVVDYYVRTYDQYYPEMIVRLWAGKGHVERFVHLRDDWRYSTISIGDPCFIIGEWEMRTDPSGYYENKLVSFIDENNGYIIILPHVLITGTYMANAQRCRRQAYLKNVTPSDMQNMNMFRGSICHELLEQVLVGGANENDLDEKMDNLINLNDNQTQLFYMNETSQSARANIEPFLPTIKEIAANMRDNSVPEDALDYQSAPSNATRIDFLPPYGTKTVHEEENLWSFQYGLKGKIDATMEQKGVMIPFELKTGSTQRGQVRDENVLQLSSYIFMLKERYKEKAAPAGVLFYLKDKYSFLVKPRQKELTNIVIHRNSIAHSISHGTVPSTPGTTAICKYCDQANICAFLDDGSSPIYSFLQTKLTYIPTQRHIEFYKHWENQLIQELMGTLNQQTSIWSQPVKKRVASGIAIPQLSTINGKSPDIIFHSNDKDAFTKTLFSISSVVLFTRNGVPPIVGRGTIAEIQEDCIIVHAIESIIEEREENICLELWESNSTIDQCRKNLTYLVTNDSPNAKKLRSLIIENTAPVFSPLPSHLPIETNTLNEDQIMAIKTALAAQDYMLLLGMPGTGKTTTLAQLIEAFERENKSVLICSHTHAAVDNLCIKLMERNINFLRIGREESISQNVRSHSLSALLDRIESPEEMHENVNKVKIFACTCLGFNHPFLSNKRFDVCVVDEASQISLPVVCGPLALCSKYILVGDHYQLPPITKNKDDSDSAVSLFRIFSENQPHALVTLRTQYRMNKEIMKLCNELVYSNRMRAGNAFSAQNKIHFPNLKILDQFHELHSSWIRPILKPEPAVLFINTDTIPMYEEKGSGSKLNVGEAAVIAMIVVSMILAGANVDSIGVISPYRAQVLFIRKTIQAELQSAAEFFPRMAGDPEEIARAIEVDTVDKFQGRDKDCIFISSVKSNKKNSPGLHATDWQRLNVAITRAKLKLIFVGSRSTLTNSPFFDSLFRLLNDENIQHLPNGVNEGRSKPFISIMTKESLNTIDTQDY